MFRKRVLFTMLHSVMMGPVPAYSGLIAINKIDAAMRRRKQVK